MTFALKSAHPTAAEKTGEQKTELKIPDQTGATALSGSAELTSSDLPMYSDYWQRFTKHTVLTDHAQLVPQAQSLDHVLVNRGVKVL